MSRSLGLCCRLTVHKSVPAVRIHFPPPTSLRFEAFSEADRKNRACGGDAPAPPVPERAHMLSHAASVRFSLWRRGIRCRLPPANILHGRNLRTSRAVRRAPLSGYQYRENQRRNGTSFPSYRMFRAVLCERHSSGMSMCRVTASAVRLVGCRPSTMDLTISGARNAKRITRPT